ncbi:hypothetical protein C0J45_1575 [Silurus meridionalis]|nr:hypothetical protein C0J45_1575 [Silurus meridionalis]
MAVVNTYFKKKEHHRVTYKSGGRCTQVDYVLCRRCSLKEIGDCKVLAGDSVARQHQMVACRIVLEVKKRRRLRSERIIRWWKLKEEDCSVRFREEVRQVLGGGEEVLDDWASTAEVIRETARKRCNHGDHESVYEEATACPASHCEKERVCIVLFQYMSKVSYCPQASVTKCDCAVRDLSESKDTII